MSSQPVTGKDGRPLKHHIGGRDRHGVEYTLCGIDPIPWSYDNMEPLTDEWCQECLDRDG